MPSKTAKQQNPLNKLNKGHDHVQGSIILKY